MLLAFLCLRVCTFWLNALCPHWAQIYSQCSRRILMEIDVKIRFQNDSLIQRACLYLSFELGTIEMSSIHSSHLPMHVQVASYIHVIIIDDALQKPGAHSYNRWDGVSLWSNFLILRKTSFKNARVVKCIVLPRHIIQATASWTSH